MSEQITATITEIANALKISRVAANKKKHTNQWQPVNESGVAKFDIDEIPLTYQERKLIRVYFNRKNVIQLRAVPSAEQLQREAEEKERNRLAARAQSLTDFHRLPPWQQQGAKAKLEIIRACEAFITANRFARTNGQELFVDEYNMGRADVAPWVRGEIRTIHVATLRTWITEEYELGMMGLADLYGNRKGQSKIETYITGTDAKGEPVRPMASAILALMFDNPHIKPKHVNESLRGVLADAPWISDKSVERWMEAWKKAHPQEWAHITNPDDCKNRYQVAFGSRSEGITGPNQRWEIDATPADLLLVDGRHKIIGICDVGTRRLIFQVTRTERATDNAATVRRALIAWGVPAKGTLSTDNGNPYKSDHFQRVMGDLDIRQHFCRPFSGDEKPFIERGFGTFSHDLVELLPGYCGHSVADRKAIEARKSFAQRLRDPEAVIEIKMTGEDLQAFCDRWCAAYHDTRHSSLGMSPNQVLAGWPHAIHRISDERALDVLLAEAPKRRGKLPTVQKKGIVLDKGTYIHPDLADLVGKEVRVMYDPADLGRIIVHRMNDFGVWEFACIAEDPDRTGISRAEAAAVARARQNKHRAEMRAHAKEAKKALKGVDIVQAVLEHRERQAAASNVAHFPRPTVDYTSPGLQAAAEAAAVLDNRNAAPTVSPAAIATRERMQAQAAERKPVFEIPHGDREKYRLWCQLEGQIVGGLEVADEAFRFYEAFQKTPAWRAFKGISEDIYSLRRT